MDIEKIRQFQSASPFFPFTLHLADGRNVSVGHPEFMMISPAEDECVIYETDGRVRFVDPQLVTEIERNAPRANGAGRKKPKK